MASFAGPIPGDGFTLISEPRAILRGMTMKTRLFLPLAALAMLSACGDPDPKELFTAARQHVMAEDFRAAKGELVEALKLEPRNRDMLALLARVQLRIGDGDGARLTLRRLTDLGVKGPEWTRLAAEAAVYADDAKQALILLGNDGTPEAWRIRAAAQEALGDNAAVRAAYVAGLQAGGDARLVANYARFLLADNDVDGAAAQIASLQRARPQALDTLLLSGDLALARGQYPAALAQYQQAAKRFPARAEPVLAQAEILDMQGNVDAAIKLLAQAEKLEPGHRRLQPLQIQLYSEKGEWSKIRDILQRKEADIQPGTAEGLTYGEALLRMGHPEQARVMFSQAVILAPENRYARMMLGEAQLATGDAKTAWRTVKVLSDSVLVNPVELQLAERAARAAGDPAADAIKARAASALFKEQIALSGTGQAALLKRDWAGAITAYGKLLQYGDDADILKRLSLASDSLGDHAAAIGYADRALAVEPENPDLMYQAGVTRLHGSTDLAGAVRLLQQAAEIHPDNALFRIDLAKAKAAAG